VCLAVPGRITWIGQSSDVSIPARIESGGEISDVDLVMVPEAKMGDYVVAHAGYAIKALSSHSATQTLDLLRNA